MDTTSPQLDHSAIGDLQRGVLADFARPTTSALAGIGARPGPFAQLADGQAVTSAQLATRADGSRRGNGSA